MYSSIHYIKAIHYWWTGRITFDGYWWNDGGFKGGWWGTGEGIDGGVIKDFDDGLIWA